MYLHLVKSQPNHLAVSCHDMQFPVIADSGANYNMFCDEEFFETLYPASGTVVLGDEKTTLSFQGVGTVKCMIGTNILTIPIVRYIPGLGESVYSLFLHIKSPDHGLDSSFENGLLYLKLPSFTSKAIIGSDDIYLDMSPLCHDTTSFHSLPNNFDSTPTTIVCRSDTEINKLTNENTQLDDIVGQLCGYYCEVKSKHQLGLPVLAGFRLQSSHQQQFILYTPPRKSAKDMQSLSDQLNYKSPTWEYYNQHHSIVTRNLMCHIIKRNHLLFQLSDLLINCHHFPLKIFP
jgi:hypothetical protein